LENDMTATDATGVAVLLDPRLRRITQVITSATAKAAIPNKPSAALLFVRLFAVARRKTEAGPMFSAG